MGPQYKYDVTNDVIDDESRAELYYALFEPLVTMVTIGPVKRAGF